MKEVFPMVEAPPASPTATLPLAKDWAWDFEHDVPLLRGGEPVAVTGTEAVKVWAFHALKTARYQYEIWTPNYGCELDRLVGQSFSSDVKQSQAVRYIEACLRVSPYITAIAVKDFNFTENTMTAEVSITTIYGEGAMLRV